MNPRYRFHRQAGVGLVEIMVAVTLSLILTAGLVQVYTGNKQTYRIQESLSRVQENGRFALDFITRDLRSAGFLGCAGTTTKIINTLNGSERLTTGTSARSSRASRRPVLAAGTGTPWPPPESSAPSAGAMCSRIRRSRRQSGPGHGPPGY